MTGVQTCALPISEGILIVKSHVQAGNFIAGSLAGPDGLETMGTAIGTEYSECLDILL